MQRDLNFREFQHSQKESYTGSTDSYGTCPNCGYCPHCGRSNHPYSPYPYVITYGGLNNDL